MPPPSAGDLFDRHHRAGQGQAMPFAFDELNCPLADPSTGRPVPFAPAMDVAGVLRGRVRPDGSIELQLRTSRSLHLTRDGKDEGGSVGGAGDMVLSLRPNETVGVVLPQTGGSQARFGLAGSGPAAAPNHSVAGAGWSLTRDSFQIDYDTFFKGHQVSLLVRASRLK